jgi:plasmid rolling circle replication initiator protein Rep
MAKPFLDTKSLIVDRHEYIVAAWAIGKRKQIALVKSLRELGGSYKDIAERVENCAECLNLAAFKDHDGEVFYRVNVSEACNYRFCPPCAKRKARRLIAIHRPNIEKVFARETGYAAGFLTLTVRSVPLANIRTGTAEVLKGWRRMTQRQRFKAAVAGFARAEEVALHATKNPAQPHLHILLAFRPGYHRRSNGLRIDHTEWREMWRGSMKDDAIRMVRIESLRPRNPGQPLSSACAELLKYPFKPTVFERHGDGYRIAPEQLEALHKGLYRRRMFGTGGVLRGLKLEKAEAALEHIDDDGVIHPADILEMAAPIAVENYRWAGDDYFPLGGA